MGRPSLGPRLYFRKDSDTWIIRDSGKDKRLGRVTKQEAERALEEYRCPAYKGLPFSIAEAETKALKEVLLSAKKRASKKNRDIDIDLPFLRSMLALQRGRCAISNLPFKLQSSSLGRCNPYGISID